MAQSRQRTGNRGSFKPGQSGNPGGRPKENHEVQQLARQHTKAAIDRLEFWMNSDNPKASVAASQALLSRGWGTPPQSLVLQGDEDRPLTTRVIHEDANAGE